MDYYLDVIAEDFEDSLRETAGVIKAFKGSIFGILGNHDFVEMVPRLEDLGLPILLNETTSWLIKVLGSYSSGSMILLEGYFKSTKGPKLSIEIQSARFLTPDVAETPVPQPPMEGQSPRNGFLSLGPHATR